MFVLSSLRSVFSLVQMLENGTFYYYKTGSAGHVSFITQRPLLPVKFWYILVSVFDRFLHKNESHAIDCFVYGFKERGVHFYIIVLPSGILSKKKD